MTRITSDMKTDWFPAEVKPVRKGVYIVEKSYGRAWCLWDGTRWSHGVLRKACPDVSEFRNNKHHALPVLRWRGLNCEV